MSRPAPEGVFTPRQPPSREMFAARVDPVASGRATLQQSLAYALREPGAQVILYGDTGVGKTTLLKFVAEDEGLKTVSFGCLSSLSFEGHLDGVLRELLDEREIETTRVASDAKNFEGGISHLITVRGRLSTTEGSTERFETLQRIPLLAVADAARASGRRLIVFDNFQNVASAERGSFAEALEVMSDRATETGDVKLAVVGVASDPWSLVGGSPSTRRRVTEVGVPPMSDAAIAEIFEKGFHILGLEPTSEAIYKLVFFSDGYPYFAHLLGLGAARAAHRSGSQVITLAEANAALLGVAESVGGSFRQRLELAFRADDLAKVRYDLVKWLASSSARLWSQERALEAATDMERGEVALAQLATPEYGEILVRIRQDNRHGEGDSFAYRFSDPYIRAFVRMWHVAPPVRR